MSFFDPPIQAGELPYPQTPEELRARAYRASLVNRAAATMARAIMLRGNPQAAKQNRLDWRPISDALTEQEP